MNKKLTMMVLGVVVGTTMLCGSAFAGGSGSAGYDTYKSAIKQSLDAKNVTPQVEVAVTDNGSLVVDLDAALKVDQVNRAMSGVITDKTSNLSVNVFKQADQAIFKTSDSEVYNVIKHGDNGDREQNGEKQRPEMKSARMQDAEKVIDALTGTLQNYVVLKENPDGTKDVSFTLTDSQIPAVVNAIVPLAVKDAGNEQGVERGMKSPFGDLEAKLPKLVDEIKLISIDMTAKIGIDNRVANQTLNITLSGKDADGKTHEVIVKITMAFTAYNNTSPDTVDLTGKQVQEVQEQGHRM